MGSKFASCCCLPFAEKNDRNKLLCKTQSTLYIYFKVLSFFCQVVSSYPSGFWPEYIEDDNSDLNLVDALFEDNSTWITAVPLDSARSVDSATTAVQDVDEQTADKTTITVSLDIARSDYLATTSDQDLDEERADLITTAVSIDTARNDDSATSSADLDDETADAETTPVVAAESTQPSASETTMTSATETTSTVKYSSSTTTNGAVSTSLTTSAAADSTTESQSLTSPPSSKQPSSDKPKKSWAEIFCVKVSQFLSFMGHKITDTASFIKGLFHWLY